MIVICSIYPVLARTNVRECVNELRVLGEYFRAVKRANASRVCTVFIFFFYILNSVSFLVLQLCVTMFKYSRFLMYVYA